MVQRIYYFLLALTMITWQGVKLTAKAAIVTLVQGNYVELRYTAPEGSIEVNHYIDGHKVV